MYLMIKLRKWLSRDFIYIVIRPEPMHRESTVGVGAIDEFAKCWNLYSENAGNFHGSVFIETTFCIYLFIHLFIVISMVFI